MKFLQHKSSSGKRGLSLLCVLALCLGLLPVTALAAENAPTTLYVGNHQITYGDTITYLKAGSTEGSLTEGSADEWTVKYDPTTATLTLKNATIKGVSNNVNIVGSGIYAASSSGPVSLNIVLEGENKVSGGYGINVSSGGAASLSISGSGSLTVSATAVNGIGIFVQAQSGDANLTINGANVNAVVTEDNGRGVELSTGQDGNPNLTIEVKGGSLQASGQPNGIIFFTNKNNTQANANLKVSGNAMVKTSGITTEADGSGSQGAVLTTEAGTGETGGIVWNGSEGTVYGTVALQNELTIGSGETLTIGDGASLTVPSGKTLTNNGTVTTTGSGTLTNNGTINNSGTLPETISGNQPPKITTASLPDGKEYTAYNETLQADNTPTQWSVTSGSLPAGLTLDTTTGMISGAPTADGTSTFTVKAENSAGSDSKAFTLTVTQNSNYFEISTAAELRNFANAVNGGNTTANAVLTADITLTGANWTPIGKENAYMYKGIFDGQGHTISGLQCSVTSGNVAGLFGAIGSSGVVKNVGIADSSVVATTDQDAHAGGVCGYSEGTIENCWNSGSVSASSSGSGDYSGAYAGGVCGYSERTIKNCWNSGSVSVNSSSSVAYAGGVCGDNTGSIDNCYWLNTACSTGVGMGRPGTSPDVESKTADEFASGEVAWLLNQGQTGTPWGQGSNGMPVLEGNHPASVTSYVPVRITIVMTDNTQKTYYSARGSTFTAYPTGYAFVFKDGDTKTWINKGTQTYDADATIYAENMTLEKIPAKAATCTENGNSAYWYFDDYKKYFSDANGVNEITAESTVIPATGHDLTNIPAKEPTSTQAGNIEYWVCSTCGKYFSDEQGKVEIENVVIPATGHSSPAKTPSQQAADKIESAKDGDTVTVDLSRGSTKLDKEVFEELSGRDVTLVIELGDGLSWTINGSDIPENAKLADIDLGVTMNSHGIPVDIINAITGERGSIQLELAHNGAFGFTMTLSAPLGTENAGYWANLYHFDEDTNKMSFETAAKINSDGTASLSFSHASQYAIVIDDHNHGVFELPFTDVAADDWFYDPVCFVYENGLMTGTSATTFEPNTPLSRAMLVAVLHRLEGSPAASGGDFTDVADGDWYAEAVNWAASVGVVNGMGDGIFAPNTAITREQMAAILRNFAAYKGMDVSTSGDLSAYSDANSVSSWAEESVTWAVEQGLIHGMSVDTLEPQGLSTRAQAATVLMNAGSLLGGF